MSTFAPPALHGIIGYPLGHSLSPLMHNTAFRTLNLPGVYLSWPIEPGRLPGFVDAARLLNIRGCSITIPHKVDIIPLLDETSARVSGGSERFCSGAMNPMTSVFSPQSFSPSR